MAEKVFKFKAASIGGEDNAIVIDCEGNFNPVTTDLLDENKEQAELLAEQLALWLTPFSVYALSARLKKMGYSREGC